MPTGAGVAGGAGGLDYTAVHTAYGAVRWRTHVDTRQHRALCVHLHACVDVQTAPTPLYVDARHCRC